MDRIAQLLEIVTDDPDDGLARFMLGRELLAAKRAEEAIEQLGRAVALTPDHTASYRELGHALTAAGRNEEALATWAEGIAVAERTGDLQTGKEMRVFRNRLLKATGRPVE
jgi:predicted Zn-dependent protease